MIIPKIPFLSLLSSVLVISCAASAQTHDDFLACMKSQNTNSISQVIYTPKSSSYDSVFESSVQNLRPASTSKYRPSIIITPSHYSQIQAAVRCSKKLGTQIRVRSGGHDYEGLSYSSDNPFVIVDLRNLRSIEVDARERTAWIGAGATLGEVYNRIAERSSRLAFIAGVCPTVGVGGHFSGGGYGMMSRRFGLSIDHIIDATIIDSNGNILNRTSMGEDLFWAIRGGGGASFGIIVSWKVSLLSIPEKVTVFNVTRTLEENATQLIHKWQHIAHKIDENLLIRLFMRSLTSPDTGKRTVYASFTTLFLGGTDDLLNLMQKNFPELGLTEKDCTEMSWINSILYFAHLPRDEVGVLLNRTAAIRAYFKGKSDFVQQPIPINGLEGIWKWLNQEDENSAELQFSPYGGILSEVSASETPFPHRAGNIFMIHYSVGWSEESESQRHVQWTRGIYSYMARYVSKSPREAYFNYKDLDLGVNNVESGRTSYGESRIWGVKYYKNNFDRLVHVKTMVDPGNLFRNEQSIPPLSS